MFDSIASNYLSGTAAPSQAGTGAPASLGNAANKSGIYSLSSDQQLAYYRSLLNKFAPAQYTPVQGNFEQGGEGAGSDQQAQQNAANAQVDVARNAAFEQTLSPEDRANYQALSKQYETNSNHSMDNMGIFSLLAAGIGGGLAGAYGSAGTAAAGAGEGAGAAGTGVAGGSAATGNMALIDSGLGTAGYGGSSAGSIAFGDGLGSAAAGTGGLENFGNMYSENGFTPDYAGEPSATGSDAHFYQDTGSGTGLQDLGNFGGTGSASVPTTSLSGGSGGFLNSLASGNYGDAASAAGNYLSSPSGLQTASGLVSSYLQSNAAGKALDAQKNATADANALQARMYDTNRADWAPYRALGAAGTKGYANLLANPNSITSDPGYAFGLSQGQTALDRSAASKGGLYSGATLKALDRYGQDYASTKLNDALGRYGNAAQIGATGVSGTQASGTNYANTSGANTTGLGNAAAGNALLNGSIWANALNGAVSSYKQYNP